MSRLLTDAGRDHVVLDRGGVGERWRSERWDSLRLLTPNWMTRLPGWCYGGPDPDGFLSARGFVAPPASGTPPRSPRPRGGDVERSLRPLRRPTAGATTSSPTAATWRARHVVVATGPTACPDVPPGWSSPRVRGLTSNQYRNPTLLAPGGVLVVGASSSGVQIADELARAGRDVVLAVGRHTRMPRRYRGMDIFWWLEGTGRLARTIDEVPDPAAARREPSLQLVGRTDAATSGRDLDLAALHAPRASALTGRLLGRRGRPRRRFGEDLPERVAAAERPAAPAPRRRRTPTSRPSGLDAEVLPGRPAGAVPAARSDAGRLDLRASGITTVVLATGFRPDHPGCGCRSSAPDGAIEQYRGVTRAPGLYVVGQRFQHRRDSGFIDGARHDARAVVSHLTTGSGTRSPQPDEETPWHETSYDVVVVGGRVAGASTAMLLARAGARVRSCWSAARHGTDTVSTHALMRAGVLQLSRWGLLAGVVAAGTPPVRQHDVPLRRRPRHRSRSARGRRGRAVRPAAHGARPDPRRRRRRAPAPTCATAPGHRSGARRDGRVLGVSGRDDAGPRRSSCGPA